jgi:hypothetical protein
MPPSKPKTEVVAEEPQTGTTPIDEIADDSVEYVNTSKGSVPVDPAPVVVPADEEERLAIANEGRDPLGYVPEPAAVALDEAGNPAENTLIIEYIGGGTKEVELEPGSIVEYLGGSFARWTEKGGVKRQAQIDVDIAGVSIKGA